MPIPLDTASAIESNIAWLKRALGPRWCAEHVSELRLEEAQPIRGLFAGRDATRDLVGTLMSAEDGLVQIQAGGEVSPPLAELNSLAVDCLTLISARVEGVVTKVQSMCKEPSKFRDTAFEIEIAAFVARLGQSVKFIPVDSEGAKTPDLLVNGEVEIECKNISALASTTSNDRDKWNLFLRRLGRIVKDTERSLLIRLTVSRALGQSDVEWTLREVEGFLRGSRKVVTAGDACRELLVTEMSLTLNATGFIAHDPSGLLNDGLYELDQVQMIGLVNGGSLQSHVALHTQFRNMDQTALGKRLRRVLKSATTQFSKSAPAVIAVRMPAPRVWRSTDDREAASEAVHGFLRQNSSVNGVVLTLHEFVTDGIAERPLRTYITQHAASPRFPADLSCML